MASTAINIPSSGDDTQQPFLQPAAAAAPPVQTTEPPQGQNAAFQRALQTTANLANFLPTGTIIIFEMFSPVTTDGGVCYPSNRYATAVLIVMCMFSGFVLSFSDSFTDETGEVRYGFATWTGFSVVEGPPPPSDIAASYRLGLRDLVHSFASLMIFAAVALLDRNVVDCFFPTPTLELERTLSLIPIVIGIICSALFLIFPNHRNGIGFPVKRT